MGEIIEIKPQPGPQTDFLSSPADIVIYGGAAGGGKTWGLLLEPLRHISNSDFGATIFRRTYKMVTMQGGMWDEAIKLYPLLGALPKISELAWRFPSGAQVRFSHMQNDDTYTIYQGAQIPLIGFDQLEHFTEQQFFYMLSRNRSTCGVKPYIRATVNPDADSWITNLVAWWIDQETGLPIEERGGCLRWFVRVGDVLVWGDDPDSLCREYGIKPKSLTFIPAKVTDNPALLSADPGYIANLMALSLVDRERLLAGNWKIRPEAGKVFNRAWFEIVDAVPAGGVECRFWDLAATEKKLKSKGSKNPDFTASLKMRKIKGIYYILDVTNEHISPAETDRTIKNITTQDEQAANESDASYCARWEQEGGASGKRDSWHLAGILDGFDGVGVRPQGDKVIRAKPASAQALAGNIKLLRGEWNEAFLSQVHGFPDLDHDDIADALSGAFNELSGAHWKNIEFLKV